VNRRCGALVVALAGAACSSSPPAPSGAPPPHEAGLGEEGGGTDTWTSYAKGFFKTYCTSCHNAQDATGRDYTQQALVAKDRVVMRCGVAAAQDPSWSCASTPAAKQFPIGSGPKPSDAERARIVAWIDAGEP
jgi:hypothetical protein